MRLLGSRSRLPLHAAAPERLERNDMRDMAGWLAHRRSFSLITICIGIHDIAPTQGTEPRLDRNLAKITVWFHEVRLANWHRPTDQVHCLSVASARGSSATSLESLRYRT